MPGNSIGTDRKNSRGRNRSPFSISSFAAKVLLTSDRSLCLLVEGMPPSRRIAMTGYDRHGFSQSEREALRVLGLAPGASREEIRNAYRALCARYHPDVSAGADGPEPTKFLEVQQAYWILTHASGDGRSPSLPANHPSADSHFQPGLPISARLPPTWNACSFLVRRLDPEGIARSVIVRAYARIRKQLGHCTHRRKAECNTDIRERTDRLPISLAMLLTAITLVLSSVFMMGDRANPIPKTESNAGDSTASTPFDSDAAEATTAIARISKKPSGQNFRARIAVDTANRAATTTHRSIAREFPARNAYRVAPSQEPIPAQYGVQPLESSSDTEPTLVDGLHEDVISSDASGKIPSETLPPAGPGMGQSTPLSEKVVSLVPVAERVTVARLDVREGFCITSDRNDLFLGRLTIGSSAISLRWKSVATSHSGVVILPPGSMQPIEHAMDSGRVSVVENNSFREPEEGGRAVMPERLTLSLDREPGTRPSSLPDCPDWYFSQGSNHSLAGRWITPSASTKTASIRGNTAGLLHTTYAVLTMKESGHVVSGSFLAQYSFPRLAAKRKVAFQFQSDVDEWPTAFSWHDSKGNRGVGGIHLIRPNRMVLFWKKREATPGIIDLTSGTSVLHRME